MICRRPLLIALLSCSLTGCKTYGHYVALPVYVPTSRGPSFTTELQAILKNEGILSDIYDGGVHNELHILVAIRRGVSINAINPGGERVICSDEQATSSGVIRYDVSVARSGWQAGPAEVDAVAGRLKRDLAAHGYPVRANETNCAQR